MNFDKKITFTKVGILLLAFLGLIDAVYLSSEHIKGLIPPCTNIVFLDCGRVLQSRWASIFGVPVAFIGVFHYFIEFVVALLLVLKDRGILRRILVFFSLVGLLGSTYLMFIQFVIIRSICLYCTLSAFLSLMIFVITWKFFEKERKEECIKITHLIYKYIVKRILFLFNADFIHEAAVSFGVFLSRFKVARDALDFFYFIEDRTLYQNILGMHFDNPVGLSAGFDYDAKLTRILPSLSFGFMTVGTITNLAYEGNPKPRLGRLPKSKSLMVNKGFKSIGTDEIIKRLAGIDFEIPVGISVGRSNSGLLNTHRKSIDDIMSSFKKLDKANLNNAYYELNISCPNLINSMNVDFYDPNSLDRLLSSLDELRLSKPIFVKMPIDKKDDEVIDMLKVISPHKIAGVIFGNLQKDRNHPSLVQEEVKRFKAGSFSGKPTWQRSNELISLAYKNFGGRFVIIGTGGIFNARDAYEKIKRGASLVQLITGMVFEGPQLISQINLGLVELLKKDGFKKVEQAVGIYNK